VAEQDARHWAQLLDIVVFLAPDLLRERINTREKWHVLKGADGRSSLEVLRASRQVYEDTLQAISAQPGGPAILRFDTSARSADEIADAILTAMKGDAAGASPRPEPARRER
jgi:hypothetical protein